MKKKMVVLIVALCSTFLIQQTQVFANKDKIRQLLLENIGQIDYIEVNTDISNVRYETLHFDTPLLNDGIQQYWAVKFRAPRNFRNFYFSIISDREGPTAYQLVQVEGPLAGFAEGEQNKTETGDISLFHKIPGQNFLPDREYILYFMDFNNRPMDVRVSLNFLQEPNLSYSDLFSNE
ncbi:MAG: hypothetical protein AB1650_08780 [Candidatus Omnitrophota bacterium]